MDPIAVGEFDLNAAFPLDDDLAPLEAVSEAEEQAPATGTQRLLEQAIASFDLAALLPLSSYILERENPQELRTVRISRALRSAGLVTSLLDPDRHTKSEAIRIGRLLMALDGRMDTYITRHMPVDERGTHAGSVVRACEILDVISPANRLVLMFAGLARHAEVHIASKATLLLGKRVQNLVWADRALQNSEPRIRASVVEAFWDAGEKASQLFRDCLRDTSSRVVGNAVYGLFRAGQPQFLLELTRMIRHPKPDFRASACWVMGRTGRIDFVPRLRALGRDPAEEVQQAAKNALLRIERPPEENTVLDAAEAPVRDTAPWKPAACPAKRPYATLLQTIRALEGARRTILVAVDGLSKAGKSHFATNLALAGRNVSVVSTTDFGAWTKDSHGRQILLDCGLDLWRMQEQLLEPVAAGKDVRYEVRRPGVTGEEYWREIKAGGILVIEGLFALRQELRRSFDYRIWVEADRPVRLARAGWRDSDEETDLWEEQRLPKEEQYMRLHKPAASAQLIVNGNGVAGVDPERFYVPGKIIG